VQREDTQGKWWMPRLGEAKQARTRLRKSLVEAVQGMHIDTGISEWGKPTL